MMNASGSTVSHTSGTAGSYTPQARLPSTSVRGDVPRVTRLAAEKGLKAAADAWQQSHSQRTTPLLYSQTGAALALLLLLSLVLAMRRRRRQMREDANDENRVNGELT